MNEAATTGTKTINTDDFIHHVNGSFYPKTKFSVFELFRHDFVADQVQAAMDLHDDMKHFKECEEANLKAFKEQSAERYNHDYRKNQASMTLTSLDGRFQIVESTEDLYRPNEGAQVAASIINEFLAEVERDIPEAYRDAIRRAFELDREGRISQTRVMELKRMKFKHPKWAKAMKALEEALDVERRLYRRHYVWNEETGQWDQVVLRITAL